MNAGSSGRIVKFTTNEGKNWWVKGDKKGFVSSMNTDDLSFVNPNTNKKNCSMFDPNANVNTLTKCKFMVGKQTQGLINVIRVDKECNNEIILEYGHNHDSESDDEEIQKDNDEDEIEEDNVEIELNLDDDLSNASIMSRDGKNYIY